MTYIVNHVSNDPNNMPTIRFDVFGDQNGKGKQPINAFARDSYIR